MQAINGMTGLYKKSVTFVVLAYLLFGNISVGVAAQNLWNEGSELKLLLEDSIFATFSTGYSYYDIGLPIELPGMCDGGLLLDCVVTSEFGVRRHPIYRRMHFHTGIDLAAPKGSPVFAPADGIVRRKGRAGGYGKFVELDHGFNWSTKYAHMHRIYVRKGQHVKKGDIIGEVGSTGVANGPHLHFEMVYFSNVVNPRSYFAALDNIEKPAIAFASR